MMWLPAAQYSEVLRKEQEYIDHLKSKWEVELRDEAEQRLRMGKRTELLGEIAFEQGNAAELQVRSWKTGKHTERKQND